MIGSRGHFAVEAGHPLRRLREVRRRSLSTRVSRLRILRRGVLGHCHLPCKILCVCVEWPEARQSPDAAKSRVVRRPAPFRPGLIAA
jgi:hypothetical protein